MRIRAACVAVDFGGTLATPGPSPTGVDAVTVLADQFGWSPPPGFAALVDQVRAQATAEYRRSGRQVPWESILTTAANRAATAIGDPVAVAHAIWQRVPDAVIDPQAADGVRDLYRRQFAVILACNTQRPGALRRATLAAAGLDDCFADLVLSSEIGLGKPDRRFYAAVARAAREATGWGPAGICFVGDTLAKDVTAPMTCGMSAVLVRTPGAAPWPPVPDGVPVIEHLADLPDLLERLP